jgi:hypothetical protein
VAIDPETKIFYLYHPRQGWSSVTPPSNAESAEEGALR